MTYPVARIRSITSRIFRRLALWVGSDRPTPREPVNSSPMPDDTSGVVANERTDEVESVPSLLGFWGIWTSTFQPGSFYKNADKDRTQKESVAA